MPFNPVTNVYTRTSNSFSHPINGTVIDDVDAENYFDDIDTAFNLIFETIPRNIVDFGADPTGVADSSPAIQAAINSLPPALNINTSDGGGAIFAPKGTFKLFTTVTIDRPLTFFGTSGTNFTANDSSTDLFHITQSFVSFRGFGSIGRPGTPSGSAKAIVVGAPVKTITDGATNNLSDILTSATANFTSSDVGKILFVTGQGLKSIASIISTTQIHMATVATATATGITCKYSFTITDVLIDTFYVINHLVGIELNMVQKSVVRNVHGYCKFPLTQTAAVWGDVGDNAISDCTFQSTDDAAGAAVVINSGGGAKYSNCKMLGGFYGISITWQATSTSLGPFISNCSIEGNATFGIYVGCFAAALDGITVTGCEIGVAGTTVKVDTAAPQTATNFSFVGNLTRTVGGNTHYDIGNANHFTIADNTCAGGGLGSAIVLRANAQNGIVRLGSNDVAAPAYTDLGTNNYIYANDWTSYTPSLASGTGTFTTATATGRYIMRGRVVQVEIVVTITTNGTAATTVIVGLPFTVNAADSALLNGRETTVGKALQGYGAPSASTALVVNYDNTYPGANGNVLKVTGSYQIA